METSTRHLWGILYPGNQTPDWSPQCALNEVLILTQNLYAHFNLYQYSVYYNMHLFNDRLCFALMSPLMWYTLLLMQLDQFQQGLWYIHRFIGTYDD